MTAKLLEGASADQCKVEIFVKTQGRRSTPAHKPAIEVGEFLADRFVEFAQARETGSGRTVSLAEGLQSLAQMKQADHLSEEEFQQAKSKHLGNT